MTPVVRKYTVFLRRQRWYINFPVAAFTLNNFIYYPVLIILADGIHTSVTHMNFVVTAYLAISDVAPSIAGDAASMFGKRPFYMTLYLCANISLAVQNPFIALLLSGCFRVPASQVGARMGFITTRLCTVQGRSESRMACSQT
jgi:MFS family permease